MWTAEPPQFFSVTYRCVANPCRYGEPACTSAVKIEAGWWRLSPALNVGAAGAQTRKPWIVAETEQPGASFAAVARRHEISRGLL